MTVGVRVLANDGRVQVTASGGETSLNFDFLVTNEQHIRIIRTRSGVDVTLTLTTDYTVPLGSINQEAGGSITLVSAALAGDIYTLLLNVPYERTSDFNPNGDFFANTLNLELDLLTQQNQQIVRDIIRSAKLPESSSIATLELPAPQASKLIGWNNLGTGMTNYVATDLSGTVVSSFIETLLDDPDAATARSTLGITGGTVNNYSATSAPTVNDDTGSGYVIGSTWIDVSADKIYTCVDNSSGAAIWENQVDTNSAQTLTNKTVNGVTLTAAGSASKFLNETGAYAYGTVLQQVRYQTGAVATGTTIMPYDDTIPQNTEGDEYMTLSITPLSATSKLVIECVWNGALSTGNNICVALFQDSTANALAAGAFSQGFSSGLPIQCVFTHSMTSGTTSATTFKVRAGPNQAATTTFNGTGGARRFGGVMASSIVITEYAA